MRKIENLSLYLYYFYYLFSNDNLPNELYRVYNDKEIMIYINDLGLVIVIDDDYYDMNKGYINDIINEFNFNIIDTTYIHINNKKYMKLTLVSNFMNTNNT